MAKFKLVLFWSSFFIVYPTCFFFFALLLLDLSNGKIFQPLPLLFLESGQTSWHSLGDLKLVSVIGFHLWSESYFYLWSCSSAFCLIFLNLLCLCIRTKALLFTLIRAFEIDFAVSPKDLGMRSTSIQRPILLTCNNIETLWQNSDKVEMIDTQRESNNHSLNG